MNWKHVIGGISAVAALIGAIAAFAPKDSRPQQTATGSQNVQVSGNQNSIIVGAKPGSPDIPKFEGQLKEDERFGGLKKSIALGEAFNSFISKNDGKLVELDVHSYYTEEEWADPKRYGLKLNDGFPDPRQFSIIDTCIDNYKSCSGTEYFIDAKLGELNYNPAATSRFIRGFFRVKTVDFRQGWTAVRLKHVSDEHIDLLKK